MHRFLSRFVFIAALLALPGLLILPPAIAAANGVAVVQAVEQSAGYCAGKNAAEAFECAKKQCVAGGAAKQDCVEMSYCYSGWTVDVFMQSKEGPHWHEYFCGWRDRQTALAAGKLACNPDRMEQLIECMPVQLIDTAGRVTEIVGDEQQ